MNLSPPYYSLHPIGSMEALARALCSTAEELSRLAIERARYYREKEIPKKRGPGVRIVYSVGRPLRTIQKRIQTRILARVTYPSYLLGGLSGRDYVQSAKMHCGCHSMLGEDVKQFFPSIVEGHVYRVFERLFHFPPVVADCLARLCTFNGRLPQGASTSSHIANLVLFDVEPAVVAQLRAAGFRYGRFIDDANASSRSRISRRQRQQAIELIQSMLRRKGLTPNRDKQVLCTRKTSIRVHGLNVDRSHPTLPKSERAKVRAAVHEIELLAKRGASEIELQSHVAAVTGRVRRVMQFHQAQGEALMTLMESISGRSASR